MQGLQLERLRGIRIGKYKALADHWVPRVEVWEYRPDFVFLHPMDYEQLERELYPKPPSEEALEYLLKVCVITGMVIAADKVPMTRRQMVTGTAAVLIGLGAS